jgi:hypothetical protein
MWMLNYNRFGFNSFLFSCQNYQEKVWSCFTKVEGFFIRNPTKFRIYFSDFSTIFYEFYKNQPNTTTI